MYGHARLFVYLRAAMRSNVCNRQISLFLCLLQIGATWNGLLIQHLPTTWPTICNLEGCTNPNLVSLILEHRSTCTINSYKSPPTFELHPFLDRFWPMGVQDHDHHPLPKYRSSGQFYVIILDEWDHQCDRRPT